MQTLRIALAQCNPLVGDISANLKLVIDQLDGLSSQSVDLVLFPELMLTGYPPEDLLFREGFVQQAVDSLDILDQALQTLTTPPALLLGLPLLENGQLFNVACYISPDQHRQYYKKRELPNYGVFDEKRYFGKGEQAVVVELKGRRLGLTICEDIWFAAAAQATVAAGAEAILNINASPYHINKHEERLQVLQRRIAETQVPVFYVNQVGGQDELVFDGRSLILDQHQQLIATGNAFVDDTLILDWHADGGVQLVSNPVDAQASSEAHIYKALRLAIRDYVNKNGFNGVVIGLSGGVDSALTLALAVDALGADKVEAVMMPSQYTSQMSLDDAAKIAENVGVNYEVIPIETMRQAFAESLAPVFAAIAVNPQDTTEENLQARIRGVLLMAISNKKRCLVLATGNKSEMAVGYATLYGDMCGGFAPLKDISKTLVYALCNWRNQQCEKSAIIPQNIIDRPPSAELKPDQTDQDSLPPYNMLDAILECYLEREQSLDSIVQQGFAKHIVQDIIRKVDQNEYKRRQAAPGVKVTKRAFGRERRYPITSGYTVCQPDG